MSVPELMIKTLNPGQFLDLLTKPGWSHETIDATIVSVDEDIPIFLDREYEHVEACIGYNRVISRRGPLKVQYTELYAYSYDMSIYRRLQGFLCLRGMIIIDENEAELPPSRFIDELPEEFTDVER